MSGWVPTSTTEEDWGRLRILIGPQGETMTDCTFFRDIPTEVLSVSWSDPFSDETLVLRFPQITPFEQAAIGELAFLDPYANVILQRVHPDEETLTTLWEGLVVEYQQVLDDGAGVLIVTCIGILHQVGFYIRAPKSDRDADTLEVICANEFSTTNRPHLRTNPLTVTGGPTGISFVHRPAWLDARSFLFETLSRSAISASDQWTIRKVAPRTPDLVKRSDRGETWTMTCGTPGLAFRLVTDMTTRRNAVYGEGVDTFGGGGKWRNFMPLADGSDYFHPLSYYTLVHPYDEDGDGGVTTDTSRLNLDLVRIEDFINFGEGVSRSEAQEIAELYRVRDFTAGFSGTATLTSDPEEGSRFDIREGDTFVIPYHIDNPAGTNLHIAKVEWDWPSGAVTLNLDTKNRDNDVLQRILERKREGTSPSKRLQLGRDSGQIADSKMPWDEESGSGWCPRTRTPRFNGGVEGSQTISCTGGQWTKQIIQAGEGPDSIVRLLVQASLSIPFAVAITDWGAAELAAYLPANPLTADASWYQDIPGVLYAAGSLGQRCGYYPLTEVDGGSVTGLHIDEDSWVVHHSRGTPRGVGNDENSGSPALLWVCIFPSSTANFHAHLKHGLE